MRGTYPGGLFADREISIWYDGGGFEISKMTFRDEFSVDYETLRGIFSDVALQILKRIFHGDAWAIWTDSVSCGG